MRILVCFVLLRSIARSLHCRHCPRVCARAVCAAAPPEFVSLPLRGLRLLFRRRELLREQKLLRALRMPLPERRMIREMLRLSLRGWQNAVTSLCVSIHRRRTRSLYHCFLFLCRRPRRIFCRFAPPLRRTVICFLPLRRNLPCRQRRYRAAQSTSHQASRYRCPQQESA